MIDLKSGVELSPTEFREWMAKALAGGQRPPAFREQDDHVVFERGGSLIVPKAVTDGGLQVPDVDGLKSLVTARGMPWSDEYKNRVVPYFASDERVDGHGDIVRQSWIFEEFETNSPMPYSHEWFAPPIGRAIDWRVVQRSDEDYKGLALFLLGLFATEETHKWADTVFRLVDAKFLTSGSVGFWPGKVINVEDPEERQKLGLGRWGLIFEENHLLEFSPCTIPANAGAHVIARNLPSQKGRLQPWDVHILREMLRKNSTDQKDWVDAESAILTVARSMWPDEEFTFHRELDVPVTLSVEPHARARTGAQAGADAGAGAGTRVRAGVSEEIEGTVEFIESDASERLTRIEELVEGIARDFAEFRTETTQVLSDVRGLLETSSSQESVESVNDGIDEAVSSLVDALKNLKKLTDSD